MTATPTAQFLRASGLLAGVALAALITTLVLAGPKQSAAPWLDRALGDAKPAASLERAAAPNVSVSLKPAGYRVETGRTHVELAAVGAPETQAWQTFESGVTRTTSYGRETIIVGPARTEQFLTVERRQGTRTWAWQLGTNLTPSLLPSGAVSFAGARPLSVAPVQIKDGSGKLVTPKGLRWSLRKLGSGWQLQLPLNDAQLPLPYVIDPAVDYPTPLYVVSEPAPSVTAGADEGRLKGTVSAGPEIIGAGTDISDASMGINAEDTFGRTTTNGACTLTTRWTTASDTTTVYTGTNSGSQNAATNGSQGTMALTSTTGPLRYCQQLGDDTAASADVDASVKVSVGADLAAAGSQQWGVILRQTSATASFSVQLVATRTTVGSCVGSAGGPTILCLRWGTGSPTTTFVQAGTTGSPALPSYTAGAEYRLRAQVTGTNGAKTVRAKVWLASAREPDAWNLEESAGGVTGVDAAGASGLLGAQVGNAPAATYTFDDFFVHTVAGPIGYWQFQPGVAANSTKDASGTLTSADFNGKGWLVDAGAGNGATTIPSGPWTLQTVTDNATATRYAAGDAKVAMLLYKVTISGGAIATPTLVGGGPFEGTVNIRGESAGSFKRETTATFASVPEVALVAGETIFAQLYRKQTEAVNALLDVNRHLDLKIDQTSGFTTLLTHPAAIDAGFTVTESGGTTSVTEAPGGGNTDTFTVVLDGAPVSDVVFDLTSTDLDEVTVPATLTFTPANWNIPQTVTVTGVNDAFDDGDDTTPITIAVNDAGSPTEYDALPDKTVTATTLDNDTAGIAVVEVAGTSVDEGGSPATDTFTVALTARPQGSDVTLNVTSTDLDEVTVSPATVTFDNTSATDWSTPKTVTVTRVNDDFDDGDDTTPITIAVNDATSSNEFDPVADSTVTATTVDNDTAGIAVVEVAGTSVDEGGSPATDTFTVALTARPQGSDVTLNVTSTDLDEVTVSPATVTFDNTSATDWSTPKTVTVTRVNDDFDDGDDTTPITIAVNDATSSNEFDPVVDSTVTATTVDNDTAGITLTEVGGTSVTEAGSTDTFTVVLTSRPLGSDAVLNVSSGGTDEVTVTGGATLTFNAASATDWSTPKTVTLTGVDDDFDDGDIGTTISVAVDDANAPVEYDSVANSTLTATTVDNDTAGMTIAEVGGTSVTEAGTADTFTVVLTSRPNGSDVTLNVTSGDLDEVTVSPATLTFDNSSATDWSTPKTVTVTGVNDDFDDGDDTTPITIAVNDATSSNEFDPVADSTVTATTLDNDAAGVTITETSGTSVDEDGSPATDTFTLVLTSRPTTGDVEVDITGVDSTEATLSATTFTFANASWNVAQTVTVTRVDDDVDDGDVVSGLTVLVDDANTPAPEYDLVVDQAVNVTTVDNDSNSIVVSPASVSVAETGTTATVNVKLGAQPLGDVVVTIDDPDSTEFSRAPTSRTYTTANWNTNQTFTITGVDEALDDGDIGATFTLGTDDAGSSNEYDAISQTFGATNVDDDGVGILFTHSGGSTSVTEAGSTDTFTVRLAAQPVSNVVLDVSSGDLGEATVSPSTLTFTNANWNSNQTVTVTGVNDLDVDGTQTSAITIAVNDGSSSDEYDTVPNSTVSVTTTDDEDGTPPTVASATTNTTGTTIGIAFNETLFDSSATTPPSAFTVIVNGTPQAAPTGIAISGSTVTLTLAATVSNGQTITVNYTQGAGNERVRDTTGNPAASFTGQAVTNAVPAPSGGGGGGSDTTVPALASSTPDDGTTVSSINSITLTATESVTWSSVTVKSDTGTVTALASSGSATSITRSFASSSTGAYTVQATISDGANSATVETHFTIWSGSAGSDAPAVEFNAGGSSDAEATTSNGTATVMVPGGATSDSIVVRIDPRPSTATGGFSVGSDTVEVTATRTSDNSVVSNFAKALDVHFPNAATDLVPLYSQDGSTWVTVSPTSGHALPAGRAEAFFRDSSNTVHILTTHLTFFTLARDIAAPAAPRSLVGVVAGDGLTLRWEPAADNVGVTDYVLLIDGVFAQLFGGQTYEAKLGAFTAADTRTFSIQARDAAGLYGPATATFRGVPSLTGLTVEQARAALAARGFTLGSVAGSGGAIVAQTPAAPGLAAVGSAVSVTAGVVEAGQAKLVLRVASAKRISLATRGWMAVRVTVSTPSQVTGELVNSRGRVVKRYAAKNVPSGSSTVRFALPAVRTAGTYKLHVRATASSQRVGRTARVQLVPGVPKARFTPVRRAIGVVVVNGSIKGLNLGSSFRVNYVVPSLAFDVVGLQPAFIEAAVIDLGSVDRSFVRNLRQVFPELKILVLAPTSAAAAQARSDGASIALVKPVPASRVAALLRRTLGR